jgi:hypothetical protein
MDENGEEVVEETSLVDDAVDLVDSISSGVSDVANFITDNTVGKLADLIYDDETMEKANASKEQYKEEQRLKKNRKKVK